MLGRLKIRRIPWTEEPGGLQCIGLQRVRHDWSALTCIHTLVFKGRVCLWTHSKVWGWRDQGADDVSQSNFDLETSVPSWWEVQPSEVQVFLPVWCNGTKLSRASGQWCKQSGSFTEVDFSIHRQMELPGFLWTSNRQGAPAALQETLTTKQGLTLKIRARPATIQWTARLWWGLSKTLGNIECPCVCVHVCMLGCFSWVQFFGALWTVAH